MKILIVSDSHGRDENIRACLNAETKDGYVDCLIHLGDMCSDPDRVRNMTPRRTVFVRGNCEYMHPLLKDVAVFDLGPHKVFAAHGHRYYVSSEGSPQFLAAARSNDCRIAMHGHTHIPYIREKDGVMMLNPGSCSKPRQSNGKKSYILMCIDETSGDISAEIKYL